jgi:hypothetical protein
VSLQGDAQDIATLPGFLGDWGKIAEPALSSDDAPIYMVGVTKPTEYASQHPRRVIVRFSSDMHELNRIKATIPAPPITFQRIFSQPNGSLFYFGSVGKGNDGSPHMGVAYVDATFSQSAELVLVPEEFEDFPYVKAVACDGEPDHFVTASRLRLKGGGRKPVQASENFNNANAAGIYLVLQFIKLIK